MRAWRSALAPEQSATSQLRRSYRRRTDPDGSVVFTIRVAADDAPVVDAAMAMARAVVLDRDPRGDGAGG